jgi:hypothetical protein
MITPSHDRSNPLEQSEIWDDRLGPMFILEMPRTIVTAVTGPSPVMQLV